MIKTVVHLQRSQTVLIHLQNTYTAVCQLHGIVNLVLTTVPRLER